MGLSIFYNFMHINLPKLFYIIKYIVQCFNILICYFILGQRRRRPPQNGVNSKPGPVTEKNIEDLEKTVVTTLVKNDPISHNQNLVENGTSHDNNGIPNKTEEISEALPPSKKVERI